MGPALTKSIHNGLRDVLVIDGAKIQVPCKPPSTFSPREANRPCEIFVYPGADHGYEQPLFNEGKNYNLEAVRATWVLIEDFLANRLKP